jgi:hypothetical protein
MYRLVEWEGNKYKVRDITLFEGTDEEVKISVSLEALYDKLKPYLEDVENEKWYEASCLDDDIGYYVPDNVIDSYDLVKYVEREYFG